MKAYFSKKQAILFDMDGVLFMSNEIHTKAYQMTFEGENILDFDHRQISGMRTDEVVEIYLKRHRRDYCQSEIDRVTSIKREHAKTLFLESAPVIQGCSELLKGLKSRFKLALATSASRPTANTFLDTDGIRAHFDFVICGTEVNHSKPAPEIYQKAMEALKTPAESCIVVEDSLNGITAGLKAGATVIGIEGTIPKNEMEAAGAVLVLPDATYLSEALL